MEEEKETSESKRTSKRAVSPRKAAPTPSPSSSNPRGILGTADEMQALDNIVPGTAKMRVDQYSKPIDHQRDMEARAQRSALIVAVLGLLLILRRYRYRLFHASTHQFHFRWYRRRCRSRGACGRVYAWCPSLATILSSSN